MGNKEGSWGGAAYEPELDLPGSRQPRRQRPPYTRRPTQAPCWPAQSRRDRIPRKLEVSPSMVPISHPGHYSAPIWTHTHPHGPLGTHGQLPYVPPRFTSSATRAIFQPATVRCIGLSRLYGYRVRRIASSPAVIMAQLQAFKADQIRAGCSAAPYTNSYFPCYLHRCAG